jgi:hypothetical protein
MSGDASVSLVALRALMPLASSKAPPLAQALALRVNVAGWQLTGRGWQRAEAAINGAVAPSGVPAPLHMRLARTQLIRCAPRTLALLACRPPCCCTPVMHRQRQAAPAAPVDGFARR